MPPFVPRKRQFSPELASTSAQASPIPDKRRKTAPKKPSTKSNLFDAVDTPPSLSKSVSDTKRLLANLDGSDSDTSLSEVDSDDFEDVPPAKKQKSNGTSTRHASGIQQDDDDESEEEEMDWEDAVGDTSIGTVQHDEQEIGDISISLNEDNQYVEPIISLATGSKGPSKRERQVRTRTHSLHVLSLMWHNTVRNSWLNDKEVHRILVDGLPDGVKREIRKWKEAMGTLSKEELEAKKRAMAAAGAKGKRGRKSKVAANGRDWSYNADHLEQGVPNLSRGDPLLRLLKILAAYWRKRFLITAPGLRKQGYMPLKRLRDHIRAWEKDKSDQEAYGERIEDRAAFRKLAEVAEGSKDVGAQLFCALLRGLGIEARMVTNLQPAGFGFNTKEEANAKSSKSGIKMEDATSTDEKPVKTTPKSAPSTKSSISRPKVKIERPARKSQRGNQAEPINLDDTDSALSDPPSDIEANVKDAAAGDSDDDESVIDVTPMIAPRRITKKYDRDMAFPNYWTEVCSPVTHKWTPVDPIVLSTIASNDELLQTFEPRGKKAELAKQVICYTVAYAADGSAKDVTIRYLKRHMLPGKTKGVRMPIEKVPVHNSRGKVKKYEEYDWFRTVMSMYDRPEKLRTAADDLEEQTDLKAYKPEKAEKEVEKESLQWYKQSAEFVLEQHLRREEALLPDAEAVKTFVAGKGDKAVEHLVYRRADVVVCKTTESWHKEGRQVLVGEQPMKMVPVRAVTLIRKREMEEAERETGEKLKQGLYARDQTDWIIPPPIENGVIPKNAFGNMDVYVPSMVPEGAVHLPLKGTAKLCRRLEIDHAEACTGFEFGKQRAVPVITGVVVAKQHEKLVRDAWKAEQVEIKRKEDTKRTAASLHWWRKMVMGLRIVERMRAEYAHADGKEDEFNPFVNKAEREGRHVERAEAADDDDLSAGGFLRPGHDEEETAQSRIKEEPEDTGGRFLADSDEGEAEDEGGGGFIVEKGSDAEDDSPHRSTRPSAAHRPFSLQSMHSKIDGPKVKEEDEQKVSQLAGDEYPLLAAKKMPSSRKKISQTEVPAVESDDDLSDMTKQEMRTESDAEDEVKMPSGSRRRASSPQVVVRRPRKVPAGRRATTKESPSKKTATAKKSKYFANAEDSSDDDMQGDEDVESEGEVVAPRRTTARTRSKR